MNRRVWMGLLLGVLLMLAGLACQLAGGIGPETQPLSSPSPLISPRVIVTPVVLPPAPDLVALQDTLVRIYQKANPGVVALRVLSREGGSRGSGFIFDAEGHIITNYHVVEGVSTMEVAFSSGYKTRGKVIATDPDSDLAVLQVDVPSDELHPLPLGDSDTVQVGQAVVAIGNPFGFNGTMTLGIVSGLGRTMESLREAPSGGVYSSGDIIQTDAAINPGNSGGPLLNLNGEVIGVNRAIFTTSFTTLGQPVNSGLGFAVSINIVKRVVPFLIKEGKYDYPYVGITSIDDLSLLAIEALGLPRTTGVYITQVVAGSPADKAGLRAGTRPTSIQNLMAGGDLIIAVDGHEVRNFGDFLSYLLKNKMPGDRVVFTILRGNEEKQVEVTLDKRPSR